MFALAREIQKRRDRAKSTNDSERAPATDTPHEPQRVDLAPGASVVEVSHLRKCYGPLAAVDDLSFSVHAGEIFSFLGPNGAGKTTTVEILEGLRDRTGGEVRVLGADPWTDLEHIKRHVGVVPQDFHFFPKLTPREALDLYARLFGVRADTEGLLERVDLTDKANDRYDTLSGGQKQKLGVALALVNDPEICFLDEPTTGLDPRARRAIWQVIRSLRNDGRTVFLTTHYLDEAQQLSDRIAIINRGRLVVSGSPTDLIARFGRPERIRIHGNGQLADQLKQLGLPVDVHDGTIEVVLRTRADATPVLQLLASERFPWDSFSTATDSLEDVFIQLVGRVEEGSVAPAPQGEVAA